MSATAKPGRLPADQSSDGRQSMWLAIKANPSAVTVADITAKTGLTRSSVQRYFKALTAAGFLEHCPAPNGLAGSWKLVNDIGHHAPRLRSDGSKVTQGEITGQIWRAMYMLKDFTFRDLTQNASIEIAEATAKDYCKRLLSAGYLKVLTKADPHRNLIAKYRLIRHSGPKAPQIQRVRRVFDPNDGAVYMVEGQP